MSAFDVTASPPKLDLKAGGSAAITVTVTNRLGRAVLGRVDPVVHPTAMSAWVKAPPNAQRSFSGQPTTEDFRFDVAIPLDKPGTSFTIAFVAIEVGAGDDNFGNSNTVGVAVEAAEPEPEPDPKPKVPWWVWVAAAVVVIGAGFAIMKMVGGKKMPDLVEKPYEDAHDKLTALKVVIQARDTLHSDTTTYKAARVISQLPAPGTKLKKAEGADTAILLVQKDFVVVPDVSQQTTDAGGNALGRAGLFIVVVPRNISDSAAAMKKLILDTEPKAGALAERSDTVVAFLGVFTRPGVVCLKCISVLSEARADIGTINTATAKAVRVKIP